MYLFPAEHSDRPESVSRAPVPENRLTECNEFSKIKLCMNIFCIGTLSILGPVQSALYGDHTYLFTNASLDFVTAMVLGTTYGIGMALAAVVLLLWQGAIYLLTLLVGSFITETMMTEISIVGGFLIAMSGLGIMKIKDFHTLNYLPALMVPIIWCLIRG